MLIMKQHFLFNKHSATNFLFHCKKGADYVLWWVGPREALFGAKDIDKDSFYRTSVDLRRISRF